LVGGVDLILLGGQLGLLLEDFRILSGQRVGL
jgi:hypothetical protein